MIELVLIRYAHFIGVFGVGATLLAENILVKNQLSRGKIKLISLLDAGYGVASLLVLAAGFTLWFGVGKPAEYYNTNWIFHTKFGLFVLIGLLSIWPTIFFLRHRSKSTEHAEDLVKLPKLMIQIIRLELIIYLIIPLLASLMAYGFGSF